MKNQDDYVSDLGLTQSKMDYVSLDVSDCVESFEKTQKKIQHIKQGEKL